MRFIRRLLQPGGAASDSSALTPSDAPSVDRRRVPVKCRGCGRVHPPYVFAENAHHYCVECARRSWKLMRLRPIARRRVDKDLERIVLDEQAS